MDCFRNPSDASAPLPETPPIQGAPSTDIFRSTLTFSAMQNDTILDMWGRLSRYAIGINGFLYLIIGLIAASLHTRLKFRTIPVALPIVIPVAIVSAIIGAFIAFVLAAIPSLIIAAIYNNVHSNMTDVEAVVLGCSQGAVISMLNVGVFHRIL